MTNLGVLFNEARKKYGFKDVYTNKKIKRYPTDHKKSKLSSTGFLNVKKLESNMYQQGFCYTYTYYKDGKRKQLSSVDILKLRNKVINAGEEWKIFDKQKALDLANYHNIDIQALI